VGAEGAFSILESWLTAAGIIIKMQIANSMRAGHRAGSQPFIGAILPY
jgi:hypothetical protein